jgi:hypothetical protein
MFVTSPVTRHHVGGGEPVLHVHLRISQHLGVLHRDVVLQHPVDLGAHQCLQMRRLDLPDVAHDDRSPFRVEPIRSVLLAQGELEILTNPVDPGIELVATGGQEQVTVAKSQGLDRRLPSMRPRPFGSRPRPGDRKGTWRTTVMSG